MIIRELMHKLRGKNKIIIFFMIFVLALASCKDRVLPEDKLTPDFVNDICLNLGCEYEIIKNAKTVSSVMDKYKKMLNTGKAEGYTPLIIIPSSQLYEIISHENTEYSYTRSTEEIISGSNSLDAGLILKERNEVSFPFNDFNDGLDYDFDFDFDFDNDFDLESFYKFLQENDFDFSIDFDEPEIFSEIKPNNSFESLIDFLTGRPYSNLIIAKIPTDKPWELAAWIPMGGFNECPFPEEQVAVFKYWYEKYGAIPAVVSYDIWELYIENPVRDESEALPLAKDQYSFCGDIVWQGVGSVDALAASLINSHVWFFWWD